MSAIRNLQGRVVNGRNLKFNFAINSPDEKFRRKLICSSERWNCVITINQAPQLIPDMGQALSTCAYKDFDFKQLF